MKKVEKEDIATDESQTIGQAASHSHALYPNEMKKTAFVCLVK